jgi:uncharacterized protein YbjT (DUF2867 family)
MPSDTVSSVTVVGGAGRTGRLVVERLLAEGVEVRVLSRHASHATDLARQGVRLFDGDIRDGSGLRRALADSAGVVFSIEPGLADSGQDRPETTMYQGVRNVFEAASDRLSRFVMVSQIYVTRSDHPINSNGQVLDWRLRGEDIVRASGIPYTVVRPSWLTNQRGGTSGVRLEQGDSGDGQIARADVAQACVQALTTDSAIGTTFEIYNEKGAPPASWNTLFSALAKDDVPDAVRAD